MRGSSLTFVLRWPETDGLTRNHWESFPELTMSMKAKRLRRSFREEFKREATNLVVKRGYSFKDAVEAVGVPDNVLIVAHI